METILLQVNSLKAYKLIEDLEALDIVKVLSKTKNANKKEKLNINDFVGIWSKKEADEVRKAISDTCEKVDENAWK